MKNKEKYNNWLKSKLKRELKLRENRKGFWFDSPNDWLFYKHRTKNHNQLNGRNSWTIAFCEDYFITRHDFKWLLLDVIKEAIESANI